ncbi:hypothetical protein ALI144C_09750 [Actinosynnema sp. ALI-1.44]|uniref:hypothetical protein n=1 Tax=Actinosynnema sp. ALI-1.44 TaxID=1933779 RepID=UPI00097C4CCC|nr:hypothetical protein [Actinosynnema sp. ALI-1.44]ONI86929.1 hypothetical protein ALI144C_09750 [Actinosynnema sp. ALI-1.44]
MKFTSSRYPQLVVHDLDVTFVDGEADVTTKPTIDALKALPAEMGVRAAGGRPAKDSSIE